MTLAVTPHLYGCSDLPFIYSKQLAWPLNSNTLREICVSFTLTSSIAFKDLVKSLTRRTPFEVFIIVSSRIIAATESPGTPGMSRARKRERSGRCRASAHAFVRRRVADSRPASCVPTLNVHDFRNSRRSRVLRSCVHGCHNSHRSHAPRSNARGFHSKEPSIN